MKHLIAALFIILTAATTKAQPNSQDNTLLDIILRNPDLSLFRAALEQTDLISTIATADDFTLLAPSNAAVEAYARDQDLSPRNLIETTALTDVLAYHILPISLETGQIRDLIGFSTEIEITTLGQHPLAFSVRDNHIFANESRIVRSDSAASNGFIHIIDQVLVPPSANISGFLRLFSQDDEDVVITIMEGSIEAEALLEQLGELQGELELTLADGSQIVIRLEGTVERTTLADVMQSDDVPLSTFLQIMEQAGLDQLLDSDDSYTIFAPSDAAFMQLFDLFDGTLEDNLSTNEIEEILRYHIIPSRLDSEILLSSIAQVGDVTVQMENGTETVLSIEDGQLAINGATILAVDLIADNGVVHIIDRVLIPPTETP